MNNVLFELSFGADDYVAPIQKYIKVTSEIGVITYPAIIQRKLDGIRCIWTVDTVSGTAVNESRNGNAFISVEWMAPQIVALARSLSTDRHVTIDGELTAGDYANTCSRVRQKREQAHDVSFTAFDFSDDSDISYEHKAELMNQQAGCIKSIIVTDYDDAMTICEQWLSEGAEGAVIKNTDDDTWVRIKPVHSEDLIITGHRKTKTGMTSLIVDYNGVSVSVLCEEIDPPAIGRIVEVDHQGETSKGSLRHPVYIGPRDTDDLHGVKI